MKQGNVGFSHFISHRHPKNCTDDMQLKARTPGLCIYKGRDRRPIGLISEAGQGLLLLYTE